MDWTLIYSQALTAALGPTAIVYALAAIGLNIHFGYTGLLNFGQVGFLAMASYGLAITVTYAGWSFWWGFGVGILGAVVFALLLGIPTLRLRADYLAIVTIAASEIVRLTVRSVSLSKVTGGSSGLTGFSEGFYKLNPFSRGDYGIGPVTWNERDFFVLVIGWTLVALATLLTWMLMRSPWGRVVKSVREDEDAARSLGKNVYFFKMQSLILGGVVGALGGFVFALQTAAVQPDNYFTPLTFFAYAVLILGGTARVFGPILGSMIFWFLIQGTDLLLRQASVHGHLPSGIINSTQVGQVRFMLVGLGLMLLMIFRPQGIFGDKNEIALDAR